jgi:hypothetical protein
MVETLARLRSRSCIIDGEAVACEVSHSVQSAFHSILLGNPPSQEAALVIYLGEGN